MSHNAIELEESKQFHCFYHIKCIIFFVLLKRIICDTCRKVHIYKLLGKIQKKEELVLYFV